MAHINLLPWRAERREQRAQDFQKQLVVAIILAGALAAYGWYLMNGQISHQQSRNTLLSNEIKLLDKQISEIKELEKAKQNLLARMQIIERLQQRRSDVVHLFDELITTVPQGVYLETMSQSGTTLSLKGRAQSNARVSTYMKNLDGSAWFTNPILKVINTVVSGPIRYSEFELMVTQSSKKDSAEEGHTEDGGF